MSTTPSAEIVKKMLAKGREKLITAEIDFNHSRFDDAASRAYYAAFHVIGAILLSLGLHFSSHGQTIGAFNREFIKTGILSERFTRILQRLYNERQAGDYDIQSKIECSDAKEDITDARELIQVCEEYLTQLYKVTPAFWHS